MDLRVVQQAGIDEEGKVVSARHWIESQEQDSPFVANRLGDTRIGDYSGRQVNRQRLDSLFVLGDLHTANIT